MTQEEFNKKFQFLSAAMALLTILALFGTFFISTMDNSVLKYGLWFFVTILYGSICSYRGALVEAQNHSVEATIKSK